MSKVFEGHLGHGGGQINAAKIKEEDSEPK
jgi:hypothetical protein